MQNSKPTVFDDIIEKAERINQPTKLDESIAASAAEIIWKKKRLKRITSSKMKIFLTPGKKVNEHFGKTAIAYLVQIKGQRRTGESFEKELDIFNFRWGKEHEPRAFELAQEKYKGIISGTQANEIIFRTYGEIFGDSPDFESEVLTGEIKCPVDRVKIEMEREKIIWYTTAKNGERSYHEYFWQFIGHFIGHPKAEKIVYVVYDAYTDVIYPHELQRNEVLGEIEQAEARLDFAESVLLMSEIEGRSNRPIIEINELYEKQLNTEKDE
jgi:hypothetical protein